MTDFHKAKAHCRCISIGVARSSCRKSRKKPVLPRTLHSRSLGCAALPLGAWRCPERLCCCREWADIAAELHRRNQFWVVAGILAELVPMGRAAVEAQKAIYDCYGAQLVCHIVCIAQGDKDYSCQSLGRHVVANEGKQGCRHNSRDALMSLNDCVL